MSSPTKKTLRKKSPRTPRKSRVNLHAGDALIAATAHTSDAVSSFHIQADGETDGLTSPSDVKLTVEVDSDEEQDGPGSADPSPAGSPSGGGDVDDEDDEGSYDSSSSEEFDDDEEKEDSKTLALREARLFESLKAFGVPLQDVDVHKTRWIVDRSTLGQSVEQTGEEVTEEVPATATVPEGYWMEEVGAKERKRPPNRNAVALEESQHEVYLYKGNFIQFDERDCSLLIPLAHFHWIGLLPVPNKPGKQEPIVVTVSRSDNFGLGRHLGIIRTVRSDIAFSIESSLIKGSGPTTKPAAIEKAIKVSCPALTEATLKLVRDPALCEKLLMFEENMKYWNYKFGVVYCKPGQTTEEEFFGNEKGSPQFAKFLELLGTRIEVKGWKGYNADLDVKEGASGSESVFTQWHDFSIMFHVSTMLKYDPSNPQQVHRKRYIGNDLVTIIFQDGDGCEFVPPTIVSNMLHVFVCVKPVTLADGTEGYSVTTTGKQGVPKPGPPCGRTRFFRAGPYFREFLLTKLVNGERQALHHPWLEMFIKRTRKGHLDQVIKQFGGRRSKSVAPSNTIQNLEKETVNRLMRRASQQSPVARRRARPKPAFVRKKTELAVEGKKCASCQDADATEDVTLPTGVTQQFCRACADSVTGRHRSRSKSGAAAAAAASKAIALDTPTRRERRGSVRRSMLDVVGLSEHEAAAVAAGLPANSPAGSHIVK